MRLINVVAVVVLAAVLLGCQHAGPGATSGRSVVVVVLDGLRPDYVTPKIMPNLYALGQDGVLGTKHHAMFPSVTRVNAATVATGCYPANHGLLGNSVYFPEVAPNKGLSTGNADNLLKIEEATGGRLLTVPSLGERLQAAGKTLFVASSGSSGSSMLLNHKFTGMGVANVELRRPESLGKRVEETVGPVPAEAAPNTAQNRWAVDAYLKVALSDKAPDAAILWLSDPDHTAHEAGIGDATTLKALKAVDGEVGRLVKGLRARGLEDRTDLLIISDHGFSTNTGGEKVSELLVKEGLKQSAESDDVVVVGDSIYVKGHGADRIGEIVRLLQATPKMGAIFTAAASPVSAQGVVRGTLSLSLIHLDHERAPDIHAAPNWSDAKNAFGYPGTSADGGVAGHGNSSPYDIHALFIATGPGIRSGVRSDVPTGQVDIAPTLCHLLGVAPAEGMDGRVVREILKEFEGTEVPRTTQLTHRMSTPEGDYRVEAAVSRVENTDYLDYARASRP